MVENDAPEASEDALEPPPAAMLELKLTPSRLTLSASTIIVNWRLALRNPGGSHIVALRVWSDLSSAKNTAISDEDAGRPDMDRAKLHRIAMIAPAGEAECSGEWQLPRQEALPVKHGHVQNFKEPRVLPVARFRLIGAGIEPTFTSFAIGTPTEIVGGLPSPLLFDDRMQVFGDLAAAELG